MFDFPVDNIIVAQEVQSVHISDSQSPQHVFEEISEVDLSFYAALHGLCSGNASSCPGTRKI